MGLVYKARDVRLDRYVAIKILSPELTKDETAKKRFFQEAKAASALDHPGICTIYDVGETADGRLYLAMAFYESKTLKERIGGAPLAVDEALTLGIQLARGLAQAHAAGIVHRDIKPANVMFGKGGEVKLLDFGIAKLAGETGLTETGAALGTIAYMSPEQTRAQKVDHRADIWSLGVVLYEMLSGRPPFAGDNYLAVVTAITQNAPPALTGLRTGIPLELERIVNRALAKDPADRYQTADDLAAELSRLRAQIEQDTGERLMPPIAAGTGSLQLRPRRRWLLPATATAAIVAALAGWLLLGRSPVLGVPRLSNAIQVTTALGVEDFPAWAPRGDTLAYAANPDSDLYGGNWDIWLLQLGVVEPVNRTRDNIGDDRYPSWSPDGRQIAFWSDRDGGGYYVMSALGGPPTRVKETPGAIASELGPAAWTPNSRELGTVVYSDTGARLELVSLESGATRQIPIEVADLGLDMKWSPDGRYLAYVDAANLSSQVGRLRLLRLDDASVVEITDGRSSVWSPGWSRDGRALTFVSNMSGTMDLWHQRLGSDGAPSGPPRIATTGMGMLRAAMSPDATRLAYARGQRVANVWRVPILEDRVATWSDAEQLTFDQAFAEFLDVSRDGSELVFDSDRSGNPDLWAMPLNGGAMRQITTDPTPDWAPRWSPQGDTLGFYSYRSGTRDIWTLPGEGGPARRITTDEASDLVPTWSADGQSIAFTSLRGTSPDIWVQAIDGGPARPLVEHPAIERRPDWSPDGQWVAFVSNRDGLLQLWRVPATGGEPERLTDGPAYYARWAPSGDRLYFTAQEERAGNLWEVSVADRVERPVTDLSGRPGSIGDLALASDGRYLYFTWESDVGDIWVGDVSWEE
jgi:Tol biopolymer transport system component